MDKFNSEFDKEISEMKRDTFKQIDNIQRLTIAGFIIGMIVWSCIAGIAGYFIYKLIVNFL